VNTHKWGTLIGGLVKLATVISREEISSEEPHVFSDLSPRISVVIPVYNEEENIPGLYGRVKEILETLPCEWELVLVDDGSKDNSFALMCAISRNDPKVKVVKLRRNYGQTAALSAGFDQAEGEVIITLDADLQNDPADIPRLLAKLDEGYDIVSGWRKTRKDPKITRILPSFFANKLISFLTGVRLHDNGCTLKAYRGEILKNIRLYGEFHRFIPALATSAGAQIAELEVNHHPRKFGKSKYGLTRIMRVVLDLITLKLLLAFHTRPMWIFGGVGFLMLGFGALCAFSVIIMKLLINMDITGNPLLYITLFSIISGTQLIGLGFLGEINIRTYYEAQGKTPYIIQRVVSSKFDGFPSSTSRAQISQNTNGT
jgi:glycosyltransferase involved in cell wall biosynthesis